MIESDWSQLTILAQPWKARLVFTWLFWDIKISKPPYLPFPKMAEFCHFSYFSCLSEKNYNLQSLWITLYMDCKYMQYCKYLLDRNMQMQCKYMDCKYICNPYICIALYLHISIQKIFEILHIFAVHIFTLHLHICIFLSSKYLQYCIYLQFIYLLEMTLLSSSHRISSEI